ncbi:hypothetical protein [Vibrio coralliilyticus]|uniref:hypothetical protein n=1 Tax=Vibrio coralliilyticus TaxID=190893 RepID=UPI001E3BE871|nr:hypothetical protein [Vibrio coralliilyticus]MCC2524464.1 hypothetical protein [Vibrio coralliilyticus]
MSKHLYCVSNWTYYALVTASSPLAALQSYFHTPYVLLDNDQLTDTSVVSAMCCEYKHQVETRLEALACDADRVLWMDQYPETLRFQSCTR